tara:strand:+ start:4200 stop:5561 length:1362 start_codon:yes stop_codon:yes gene_type:complete
MFKTIVSEKVDFDKCMNSMKNNFQTQILKKLANLQLAILLLFIIGAVIALGTFIEQDQTLDFYRENYPEASPIFGFLTWKVITLLNLDHVYTAWWFITLLVLFVSSLLACTFTTQLPSLKTFKIWKFLGGVDQFKMLNLRENIRSSCSNTFAFECNSNQYNVFRQSKKSYAYRGLLGRVAPVVVHISIALLLFGSTLGSFGGYAAQESIPRGEIAHVQNVIKAGSLSYIPQNLSCRINDFWITYTKDSKIDQFYSDVSLLDNKGYELKRKTIFVNEPLVYNGLTFYQTDWDVAGLKIKLGNKKLIQVPLKKIVKGGKNFWFGSLKTEDVQLPRLFFVLTDLQGKISVYDTKGNLLEDVLLGGTFVDERADELQFVECITTTGLQIKADPGIFLVYFSFLLLMVSVYTSFLTYSQIWALESQDTVFLGGKSNRAVLFFQEEFRKIVRIADSTIK